MKELIRLAVYGLIAVAIAALLVSAMVGTLTTTDPLKTVAYTLLFAITGTVIAVVVLLPFVFAARPNDKTNAGQQEEKPEEVQGKRKRGAPPLTERLDAEYKKRQAQQYLEYIQQGQSKKIAAGLVGYPERTLNRWVRDFGLTENDKK